MAVAPEEISRFWQNLALARLKQRIIFLLWLPYVAMNDKRIGKDFFTIRPNQRQTQAIGIDTKRSLSQVRDPQAEQCHRDVLLTVHFLVGNNDFWRFQPSLKAHTVPLYRRADDRCRSGLGQRRSRCPNAGEAKQNVNSAYAEVFQGFSLSRPMPPADLRLTFGLCAAHNGR